MAHFYGSMKGSRGKVTRCGGKQGGITAHLRGWDVGAEIEVLNIHGRDVCRVYATSGSNASEPRVLIREFSTIDEVKRNGTSQS